MRRSVILVAPLALALAAAPRTQPRLAESVAASGRALEYVRALAEIGPRLTGTSTYRRAARWAAAEMRAAGIQDIAFDGFTIPDGWERVRASARIAAPSGRDLHVAALGWTPSTPDGGVEADVVAVPRLAADSIARLGDLHDRIVLLPVADVGGNPSTIAERRRALDVALHEAGVRAILSPEPDGGNVLAARDRTFGAQMGALPAAQIGADDAREIRRLAERGRVRVALDLQNRVLRGPVIVDNVVGVIRGRDRPDEWVLVGAHLDSWDFSPGVQDNAAGAAMVLDAARAIAALPKAPRRSIRFVLWGGEEQGQLGSNAYARAHAAELDDCVAVLNADAGTGRQLGWTAPGRSDVARVGQSVVAPTLAPIGGIEFDESMRYAFQSDGAAFVREGVPVLDLNADDSRYEEIHHKATDTLARLNSRHLAAGAAIVAATAYAVADAPDRIAPRRRVAD